MTNKIGIHNGILYASKMVINAKTGWYRLRIIFWHTDILVGRQWFFCICVCLVFSIIPRNCWQINHRMSLSPSKFIIEWVYQPLFALKSYEKAQWRFDHNNPNKNGKIRFFWYGQYFSHAHHFISSINLVLLRLENMRDIGNKHMHMRVLGKWLYVSQSLRQTTDCIILVWNPINPMPMLGRYWYNWPDAFILLSCCQWSKSQH